MVISDSPLDSFRKCLALFLDPDNPDAVSIRSVPAGSSIQYTLSAGFSGLFIPFGVTLNDAGVYMIAYGAGYGVNKPVAAANNITITHSGATYTITNNSQYVVPIYVITLIGTATEV